MRARHLIIGVSVLATCVPLAALPCSPPGPAPCVRARWAVPGTTDAPLIAFKPGVAEGEKPLTFETHQLTLVTAEEVEIPLTPAQVQVSAEAMFFDPAQPLDAGATYRIRWTDFCAAPDEEPAESYQREQTFTVQGPAQVVAPFATATYVGARTIAESKLLGSPCVEHPRYDTRWKTEFRVALSLAPELEPYAANALLGSRLDGGDWAWSLPGSFRHYPQGYEYWRRVDCTERVTGRLEFALHLPGSTVQPEPIAIELDEEVMESCPQPIDSPPPPPATTLPPPPSSSAGCSATSAPSLWTLALLCVAALRHRAGRLRRRRR